MPARTVRPVHPRWLRAVGPLRLHHRPGRPLDAGRGQGDAGRRRNRRAQDRRRDLSRHAGRPRADQESPSAPATRTASASPEPSSPSTARRRASPPGATGPTTSRSAIIRPATAGYPAATAEQVRDAVDWAYANKIQIITHANGEAASDQLIAFIGAATKKHGAGDRRSVLIHGQFLREDQVDSYKALGVIPSLFPMHTFYWGDWHRDHTVGPVLAENISPTGWCVEARHEVHLPPRRARRLPGLDARARCHRHPPLPLRRHPRPAPARGRDDRAQGDDDLARLAALRGERPRARSKPASSPTSSSSTRIRLPSIPRRSTQIKVFQTIKEGVTVYLAGEKKGAHLSRPDKRGEHAFSNFIRNVAAEDGGGGHEGHNHGGAEGHCCGCRVAALLGDALASSSAH